MTVKETIAECRKAGMYCEHNDGEYRVTFYALDVWDQDERESLAYYTNDAQDALDSALRMKAERK